MKTFNALVSAAVLAAPTFGHVAIKPPSPDKALTPNSSVAPEGCKLLASDKGWPEDEVWKKAFPDAFRKLKGTEGPDYWVQAKDVETVQKAVNFAREHNVRLTVISSGHDFHGREDARSGLRIDMAALMEPTVFLNDWKCGDTPKATTLSGRSVDGVIACKVPSQRRNVGRDIPQRKWDWHYFEKRAGHDQSCDSLVKRHLKKRSLSTVADACAPIQLGDRIATPALCKRHGPDGDDDEMPPPKAATPPPKASGSTGSSTAAGAGTPSAGAPKASSSSAFTLPPLAEYVPSFNTIKPEVGKQQYARVSAGMYNELFYNQADKSGLMTLGAQHGGVNVVGGWAQAGGHNPFAHKFGLQVDNIVEFEVVTPDGKFQKASECSNPELYWALRGGGGSTFGIVTGATIKVYPTFPITVARFLVNSTEPYSDGLFQAVAHFLQQGAKLRDAYGLQGYFYVYPNAFHSVLHLPDQFSQLENARKAVEPLKAELEKLAGGKPNEVEYYQHATYKDWYVAEMGDEEMEESGEHFLSWYDGAYGEVPSQTDAMMNPMSVLPWILKNQQRLAKSQAPQGKGTKVRRDGPGHGGMEGMGHGAPAPGAAKAVKVARTQPMGRTYLDSRLLSDKHVNSVSIKELAAAINATFPRFPGNHVRGFLYGGGKQAEPAIDAMGLLPAWRQATYHFIINAVPGDSRNDYNIHPLAKLFPDAGGYVNEAAPQEPNWKQVYWGANYPKLEAIKKKIDPNNVLWCSPCVGADLLTYDDERICKNPNYPQSGPSPQLVKNPDTKVGIGSLPGEAGIPNPLLPIINAYMTNKTLPTRMPGSSYFKMAMGQGGSAGGKWSFGPPKEGAAPVAGTEEHGHGGMDMGAPKAPASPVASPSAPPAQMPGGHSHGDAPAPKAPGSAKTPVAEGTAAPVETPATAATTEAAPETIPEASAEASPSSEASPAAETTPSAPSAPVETSAPAEPSAPSSPVGGGLGTPKGKGKGKGKSPKGKGKSSGRGKGKSKGGFGKGGSNSMFGSLFGKGRGKHLWADVHNDVDVTEEKVEFDINKVVPSDLL